MSKKFLNYLVIKRIIFSFLLFVIIPFSVFSASFNPNLLKRVSPESQGFDSQVLISMLEDIKDNDYEIHEILIVKDNNIVFEQYFPPYNSDTLHAFKSVSKSIISLLVGIAISEGKISLDTTVYEIFPEVFEGIKDVRKKEINLRHLLTMTPGFDLTDNDVESDDKIIEYLISSEWIKKYLEHPLTFNPGEKFRYFTPTTNLLTVMLSKKIGQDLGTYAFEKLFKPLGIENLYWQRGPKGFLRGGSGIYSTILDMSKIVMLLVNNGKYNGIQLIDTKWIEESTSNRIGEEYANYGNQKDIKYGYQWWVPNKGSYMALGWGGQLIFVAPELKLFVIITGCDFFKSNLVERFVLPALKSYFWPLNDNKESYKKLIKLSEKLSSPIRSEIFLPEIAKYINEKKYLCTDGTENEILKFELNYDSEGLEILTIFRTYKLKDKKNHTVKINVGLDGIYRKSKIKIEDLYLEHNAKDFGQEIKELDFVSKGKWKDEKTLYIKNHQIGDAVFEEWTIVFENNENIDVEIIYKPSSYKKSMKGKLINIK